MFTLRTYPWTRDSVVSTVTTFWLRLHLKTVARRRSFSGGAVLPGRRPSEPQSGIVHLSAEKTRLSPPFFLSIRKSRSSFVLNFF